MRGVGVGEVQLVGQILHVELKAESLRDVVVDRRVESDVVAQNGSVAVVDEVSRGGQVWFSAISCRTLSSSRRICLFS